MDNGRQLMTRLDSHVRIKINYEDVRELKAHGKGLSTTSKVLIGVGIGFVITTGLLVLLFKDSGHIGLR